MDPLTHGLLGAACGQALYGRRLDRSAATWGGLVGLVPDLDTFVTPFVPMGEWLWHRGPTHALWFGLLVGPALGWALWKRRGGRLADWLGLAVVALVTHPLLDVFTTYGTQLLWPLSRTRVALDAVPIIDPAYTLLLALGILVGRRLGPQARAARVAAWGALVASSAYLALGLGVNARVERIAGAQLAAEGASDARVAAYPTLLQLPYRRIVARSGDEVRIGWLNAWAPQPVAWEGFRSANDPLVAAARQTREAQLFEWFAQGETAARVRHTGDGAVVELDDLRYGIPGPPQDGLWGVRVRLDASGRPLAPVERFRRSMRLSAGEMLRQLGMEIAGGR